MIVFAGPLSGARHGQYFATQMFFNRLVAKECEVFLCDTAGKNTTDRTLKHICAVFHVVKSRGNLYLSMNSNSGIYLSIFVAFLSLAFSGKIFLHYHSYRHIRKRNLFLGILCYFGASKITHIVLGDRMKSDFFLKYPAASSIRVVGNAGFVEPGVMRVYKSPGDVRLPTLHLGHLSNLTVEKGVDVVIDFAIRLKEMGFDVNLHLAGPISDADSQKFIDRANDLLGDNFLYYGPVYAKDKTSFFSKIDLFIFPSRYLNEAEPLVLLEAMSFGVPCMATDIGCISDDLDDLCGFLIDLHSDFVDCALERIKVIDSSKLSNLKKAAFDRFGYLRNAAYAAMDEILVDMR